MQKYKNAHIACMQVIIKNKIKTSMTWLQLVKWKSYTEPKQKLESVSFVFVSPDNITIRFKLCLYERPLGFPKCFKQKI